MTKKTEVFTYSRVTSAEQAQSGYSLESQREALRDYAAKNNLEIVSEFSDIGSGSKTDRKGFIKMFKAIKDAFESGMHRFSQSLQKNIEEWETERRKLILEEQEMLKTTKTFFEQSNQLLEFCKDCHRAFLKGNADLKRKIIQIVCSNFSYDGSNIVIEPNPIFKAVIKNGLNNKKLPRLDSNQQPTG